MFHCCSSHRKSLPTSEHGASYCHRSVDMFNITIMGAVANGGVSLRPTIVLLRWRGSCCSELDVCDGLDPI